MSIFFQMTAFHLSVKKKTRKVDAYVTQLSFLGLQEHSVWPYDFIGALQSMYLLGVLRVCFYLVASSKTGARLYKRLCPYVCMRV